MRRQNPVSWIMWIFLAIAFGGGIISTLHPQPTEAIVETVAPTATIVETVAPTSLPTVTPTIAPSASVTPVRSTNTPEPTETLMATPTVKPTPTQAATATAKPIVKLHIVVQGDTLYEISRQHYGTYKKWFDIYRANSNIVDPNLIYVNDVLVIPE